VGEAWGSRASPAPLLVGGLPIGLCDEVTEEMPGENEQEQIAHARTSLPRAGPLDGLGSEDLDVPRVERKNLEPSRLSSNLRPLLAGSPHRFSRPEKVQAVLA